MKIAFPTDENMGYLSPRGAHFGKARYYTIVTLEEGRITDVKGVQNPGHDAGGCGNAVANIVSLGVDALVVAGIGGSPAEGFARAGLPVYVDRESPTVGVSVEKLAQGQLAQIGAKGTCSAH
ncbi:MAG TPA: dinitrogenase iron-molybdenum cofactor biosynthesis protein [Campylobacteraceae bacterium]|nr:dinitrogenase iron-molybdenum cofactor biosynthesis protein [Campylobacterota bacterium]HHD77673.1 dinitrogenase iron-molybdenum cofactor biosynthesis protein [Campylobacteraceae bacterium]HHD84079.1 dinitrogenase iron-molybdenum cofactor biosynthesis protein [Campylobacteraceae bacterium]